MTRMPVESAAIRSIGYEVVGAVLEIEFDGGTVYQYFGVPADVHERLMSAMSHGHYFEEFIRDRYRYSRVGVAS